MCGGLTVGARRRFGVTCWKLCGIGLAGRLLCPEFCFKRAHFDL